MASCIQISRVFNLEENYSQFQFFSICFLECHILSSLRPPKSDNRYNLRLRKKHHNRELLPKNTHLFDCNFIVRLLYKDCY